MRAKRILRPGVLLLLTGIMPAAMAQPYLCSQVLPIERDFARAIGACRDIAPIVDIVPQVAEAAPPSVVIPVPNVVGLSFDDARTRLARFELQRSYRASGEPGGTVLAQQPTPPTRLPAGFPVTVVISDGTLRPAPRVTASEVDGVRNPPVTNTDLAQSPATDVVPRGNAVPSSAPSSRAGVEQLRVPNVLGLAVVDAHARLGRFKVERTYRPSSAPDGRVIGQIPTASARAEPGQAIVLVVSSGPARPDNSSSRAANTAAPAVAETFELPDLIGRSYADASGALSEFKVDRIDIASAVPSGEVLAQDPAPGISVSAGGTVSLQVSDGSLANAAATPPVAEPALVPAPTPEAAPVLAATAPVSPAPPTVQSDRLPFALPSNAVLMLIAGVLLGLMMGALLMRRWLLGRQRPTLDIEPTVPVNFSPVEIAVADVPAPEIKFIARHEAGETAIQFAAPADADEATLEVSNDHHA